MFAPCNGAARIGPRAALEPNQGLARALALEGLDAAEIIQLPNPATLRSHVEIIFAARERIVIHAHPIAAFALLLAKVQEEEAQAVEDHIHQAQQKFLRITFHLRQKI